MLSAVTTHRRFLHQIPELGDQLPQTLTLVTGILRGHRCNYFSPIQGSVCVWFDFGQEETVAFRADMDALPIQEETGLPYASVHPGQMHACGHDGHTAMALALSQWLSGISDRREILPRNVLVIFQPAEETTGGAQRLCETGIFERYRVKRIFGLHLWPKLAAGKLFSRSGALMARSNEVTVEITGKSVHLSRAAEGKDALMAGISYLTQVNDIAAHIPPPCVLRFGKMESGTVRNAISGFTHLEGSLRTYQEETYNSSCAALEEIGRQVAEESGCQVALHISDGYPAVWNHEELYQTVCDNLEKLGDEVIDTSPVLAAEDFSFYQKRVPGVFFFLGTGNTPELHTANFNFDDERILPIGVEFLKHLAQLP